MSHRYIGASIRRREDTRLLTGRGRFVDDIELPEMVHMAVYRAPYAHARIRAVNLDAVRQHHGVVAAWSYADIADVAKPFPLFLSHPSLKGKMYEALVSARWPNALVNRSPWSPLPTATWRKMLSNILRSISNLCP